MTEKQQEFINIVSTSQSETASYLIEKNDINILSYEDKYYVFNPETVLFDTYKKNELENFLYKIYNESIYNEIKTISQDIQNNKLIDKSFVNSVMRKTGTLGSESYIKSVFKIILKKVEHLKIDIIEKQEPYLIPIANKRVMNLKEKKVIDRKKEHYFTFELDCEYNPDMDLSLVNSFINPIMVNNDDKIHLLQEIIGCFFTGESVKFSFSFFGAKGNNGKTALINVIEKILKGYKGNINRKVIIKQKFKSTAGEPELLALRNFRLAVLSEIDSGDSICETKFKELTGADKIDARLNFSNDMKTFTNVSKLCFLLNKPIYMDTGDNATKNRILNTEFRAVFSTNPKKGEYKQDPSIPDRLSNTFNGRSQFFTWAVEGCKRFYDNNMEFTNKHVIEEEKEMYLKRIDPYLGFVSDCCKFDKEYNDRYFHKDLLRECRNYLTRIGSDGVDIDSINIKKLKKAIKDKAYNTVGDGVVEEKIFKGYPFLKGLSIENIMEEEEGDNIDFEDEDDYDNNGATLKENQKLKVELKEKDDLILKLKERLEEVEKMLGLQKLNVKVEELDNSIPEVLDFIDTSDEEGDDGDFEIESLDSFCFDDIEEVEDNSKKNKSVEGGKKNNLGKLNETTINIQREYGDTFTREKNFKRVVAAKKGIVVDF